MKTKPAFELNKDQANVAALLQSLVVYAVCAALAVVLGVTLTNPMQITTFGFISILLFALSLPLLIHWHQPLLLFSWNVTIFLFFVKGAPNLWLAMVVLSLIISVAERILTPGMHFISAPQITRPLLFLVAVVLVTAKLTGGFGLRAFGSDVYGGKKYIFLLIGILSFFALTAKKIPPRHAKLYTALFFLGAVLTIMGDFSPYAPGGLRFFFAFFESSMYSTGAFEFGTTRLAGVGNAGTAIAACMMAIYGVRGIFFSGKLWRPVVFVLSFGMIFMGGFRSAFLQTAAPFFLLFFLEGLHRTKMLLVFVLLFFGMAGAVVPMARHLPFTFQRTLAFLPLDLDPDAKRSAQDSLNFRFQMWDALLPQVPKHLLLGKGYGITQEDYENMGYGSFQSNDPSQSGFALAGDYHNGVLSVLLPFGIWGLLGYLWFLFAGLQVVYRNYRYGAPALRTINAFLFVSFLVDVVSFVSVIAGMPLNNIGLIMGKLALSVALNGGVARPAPAPQERPAPWRRVPISRTAPRPALPPAPAEARPL